MIDCVVKLIIQSGTSYWANAMLSDGTYQAGSTATVGTVVEHNQLGSIKANKLAHMDMEMPY